MVYMYHSFLIHSSADGHLGCFHVQVVSLLLNHLGSQLVYLVILKYNSKKKDRINPVNLNCQFLEQGVSVVTISNSDKWGLLCLEFSVFVVSFMDLGPLKYSCSHFSLSHTNGLSSGHLQPLQIGLFFLTWIH